MRFHLGCSDNLFDHLMSAMDADRDEYEFGHINFWNCEWISRQPCSSVLRPVVDKESKESDCESLQLSWKILTNSLKANSSGVSFSALSGFNEMFHSCPCARGFHHLPFTSLVGQAQKTTKQTHSYDEIQADCHSLSLCKTLDLLALQSLKPLRKLLRVVSSNMNTVNSLPQNSQDQQLLQILLMT